MPIIALDTFTDTDLLNLLAHTPDLGFGSWTYSGAANEWRIIDNEASKTLTNNDNQFCRSDLDIVDDNFDVFADYRSGNGCFAGERAGLYLLAHKSTAIALGEGVEVIFRLQVSGSVYRIEVIRRDSAGVEQQNVSLGSVTIVNNLRLGATVSGLEVQVWTEPDGGGTRTNRGSAVTLTADLRDGNHKRIGITGRSECNAPRGAMDNLTVTVVLPPTGQVQFDASIQNAFAGRVQVSSLIIVKRLVLESDQFSPGVHFDGLNPRFYRGSSFKRRES